MILLELRITLLSFFCDDDFIHLVSGTDSTDHIHILSPAKDCMDAIQVRLRGMADEELASTGIPAAVSHRQRSGQMLIGINFAINRVAGTTGAISFGTSPLDNEVGEDAMKL